MVNHPRRSKRATVAHSLPVHDHDADYASLLNAVTDAFAAARAGPLFTTSSEELFQTFLNALPDERSIHTCSACARFVNAYGGLVTINENGSSASAIWSPTEVPEFYRMAISAMANSVQRARVTGRFMASEETLGTPRTGTWTHFAVTQLRENVYRPGKFTAGQAMAAKHEDFGTVARALSEFSPHMLAEALRILEAGHLARSDKFIGPVRWLVDMQTKRAATRDHRVRDNILWRAIATAPDGYCHPKASVIGPLLEDLASGMAFAQVQERFNAKLHPLMYQRPQAAPSVGNLAAAEKLVEKLGIARSLERRFARLDDVRTIWTPKNGGPAERPAAGVFAHLAAKSVAVATRNDIPPAVITWDKFARTILPDAERLDFHVHPHGNYCALVTATHAAAPPILKWDHPEDRYPVSGYVYHGGSNASQWGLQAGAWCRVTAVARGWEESGVTLLLDGAADSRTGQGNALFPEALKSELHEVRATIEAYSKTAELTGRENATACGLAFGKGPINCVLRATVKGRSTDYRIDRWD